MDYHNTNIEERKAPYAKKNSKENKNSIIKYNNPNIAEFQKEDNSRKFYNKPNINNYENENNINIPINKPHKNKEEIKNEINNNDNDNDFDYDNNIKLLKERCQNNINKLKKKYIF